MNQYKLEINKKASKEILSLNPSIRTFIIQELESFISKFNSDFELELIKTSKVKALKGDYKGLYRLRLRTYRIIYEKHNEKLVILVLRVAHRKDVY